MLRCAGTGDGGGGNFPPTLVLVLNPIQGLHMVGGSSGSGWDLDDEIFLAVGRGGGRAPARVLTGVDEPVVGPRRVAEERVVADVHEPATRLPARPPHPGARPAAAVVVVVVFGRVLGPRVHLPFPDVRVPGHAVHRPRSTPLVVGDLAQVSGDPRRDVRARASAPCDGVRGAAAAAADAAAATMAGLARRPCPRPRPRPRPRHGRVCHIVLLSVRLSGDEYMDARAWQKHAVPVCRPLGLVYVSNETHTP